MILMITLTILFFVLGTLFGVILRKLNIKKKKKYVDETQIEKAKEIKQAFEELMAYDYHPALKTK